MGAVEAVAHLLATARGDAAHELAQAPDLGSRLSELEAAARAQWPGVRVAIPAFFGHVGRHLPEKKALVALGELHGPDLYLAFACAMHDPHAMSELERVVLPPLVPAVARVADDASQVEDIMQNLMTRLFTEDGSGEPKILQYSGKGPLGAWLRVAAVRTALSSRRKRVDEPQPEEQLLARIPESGGADPEIVHLRAQYASEFEGAFHDTIRQLQPRDRNLLHLHFIDGLTTDQIGLTYGVHGATAARWIGRAREVLFEGTKTLLAERLRLTPSEFQSLMGLLLSQLDVSIRHLLADDERAGSFE